MERQKKAETVEGGVRKQRKGGRERKRGREGGGRGGRKGERKEAWKKRKKA